MPNHRTVLVAGATGVLGVHVVQQLVADEYDVIGLTRSATKRTLLEGFGARAVIADVLDAAALEQVLRQTMPTAVIHLLTAFPKAGPLRPSQLTATNHLRVAGTANLVGASMAAGVRRIVGESFISVYGFGNLGATAKTEADPFEVQQAQPWRQAAVDALRSLEHQLLAAQHQGALEAIVLRYGVLYGPDVPTTQAILQALHWRVLPRVRGVDGLTSFIHIADATAATLAALEHGRPGAIYNIVDDEPANMEDFVGDIARAIGAPRPFVIPFRWLEVGAPVLASLWASRLLVANAQAKRELGWLPQFPSYREGLSEIVKRVQGR
jgi:nucleoside-diphosphate-sugar epimerase